MTFPDLNEGARIGRLRFERALGSGGIGAVWAARVESEPGASFALKILHPEVAARPEARQRLAREAKASNLVDHPGVARVREVMDLELELSLLKRPRR